LPSSNPGMRISLKNDRLTLKLPNQRGIYTFERAHLSSLSLNKSAISNVALRKSSRRLRDLNDSSQQNAYQCVRMFSPISALSYDYIYSPNYQQWCNVHDNHFLIELLTREILKECKSVPNF